MSRFAPISRGRQAAQRTLAALALAAASAACAAAPAEAGDFRVHMCKTPDGAAIPLDLARWTPTIGQAYSAAAEGCASGSPLGLYMGSPGAPSHYAPGDAAKWRLRSPFPIKAAWVRRTVATTANAGDQSATPEYRAIAVAGGATVDLEHCVAAWGCQLGDARLGDDHRNDVYLPMPPASYVLEFLAHCGGSGRCANGGSERIAANFHRVELLVSETSAPAITYGTMRTGSLLNSGLQAGVRSFNVRADDYETGVYEAVATVDGAVASRVIPDENGGRCKDAGFRPGPDFRDFTPCKQREVPIELALDTRKYADGAHNVVVDVFDAAGNAERVFEDEITFENVPAPRAVAKPAIAGTVADPRPSDVLTAVNGTWEGEAIKFSYQWQRSVDGAAWADIPEATKPGYGVKDEDIDRFLRVIVTAANKEGTTSVATDPTSKVRSGKTAGPASPDTPPNGGPGQNGAGGDASTAQLVVDREQRTVDVKHGAKIVITGRLVDADGQPIADAEVDIFEQLVLTAAPWQKIGTVKTDSQGGYVFRPKTTASRRLRFAFADRRDAANYRATREVLVSVQAAMSISAQRRVLKPRGMIRLRGRVTVDSLPKTGTWVEVQVLDAGVWRTVATRKTSSKGLWTFKHRLRQSAGVSFRFRARLRVVGDVASAEAKSAPVKVRVR